MPYTSVIKRSLVSGDKGLKVKDQQVYFNDGAVLSYYQNEEGRQLKSLFVQRIKDSATYILLFPTGLLLHVSSNILNIQSKLQLNLKKDETIIDVAYCVESEQQNHCLWLMDEKLQVWKCTNELNPNSSNWSLIKITAFDTLYFKKFLKPAMTYEDYFVTTSLSDISSCHLVTPSDYRQKELLYSFNESSTKCVILKQPNLE